ncbi:MAG: glycosyl hydrolase [Candidatus Bathyarchaeia archaeon]
MLDRDIFKNPPSEFRGMPFWSLNDRLDPGEVKRQVDLLGDAGYGGVFFHAREGLATPFLGREWFEAFEAAIEEASSKGMYVWIYDELWWPSGFAGGIVPAIDPRYRAKAILMIPGERAYKGSEVVATFRCRVRDGLPVSYERIGPGEESGDYVYLTFVKYTASPGETWFCGFSYVDLLDPNTIEKFIEAAYEPYAHRYLKYFGGVVPGVFTDEPNFSASRPPRVRTPAAIPPRGPRFPVVALPWTDNLSTMFKERYGYDVLDRLPELFLDIGNYTETRYHFWKLVTLLFVESFSKQLYEWCDKHNLRFTGHYLAEDTLLSQIASIGAAMPHYEYQHIPGIDHLGMQIWRSLLTAKQVASVANQLGRDRVLCEAYGCLGNYPSFADRKWIGDWLYAMGINLLNHHLVPYSMRGRRKRDYGLNIHWSQPWWKYNRVIEDYYARLSYILSRGYRPTGLLVIHPIGGAWSLYSPLNTSRVVELDRIFERLLRMLLSIHMDFDLGDEILIEKYGRVADGKLYVGRIGYEAILIPPSPSLSSSTVRLLEEFVESGGLILAVSPSPYMIDGRPSDSIHRLIGKARVLDKIDRGLLEGSLKDLRRIIVEGDPYGDVLLHLRVDGDSCILFIANSSRVRGYDLKIGIEGVYTVELWDPFTGSTDDYLVEYVEGRTLFRLELQPLGSTLFILKPGSRRSSETICRHRLVSELSIDGVWSVRRKNLNVLVLDYCRYSVGGAWSDLQPLCRVQEAIAQSGLGSKFRLRFEFQSEVDFADRKAYLVVEKSREFKVEVNGIPVEDWSAGYWIDTNFLMADISGLIGRGLNTIELEGVVGLEPELENIYILGDFGVEVSAKGASKIVEEPREVELGDMTHKGYPFYAGELELERVFELDRVEGCRIQVKLDRLDAALASIYLNDIKAAKLILLPYEVDVTDYVREGTNTIRIVLVGTLRNALGPLHHKLGDPDWVSPESFRDPANWTDEYILKPFGVYGVKLRIYN